MGRAAGDQAVGEAIGDGMSGTDGTPATIGAVVLDHASGGILSMAVRAAADQVAVADKFTGGAEAGNNFGGIVHGIWPRLKRDRRRDGRSLFGPPGQLAKREQPGTGNEEERRRFKENGTVY
ncbi:hypothetical protein DUI87_17757 [Hirundo rustica rustica]|uniref:Uncharacterized protein n=1 Tax=Hirundo rustica rustica TaxID=333673 RepID=A0A3M0JXA1_HIRRU|nr:hypothetical protein DUI87_17757 [Hirundo rustica rustica]